MLHIYGDHETIKPRQFMLKLSDSDIKAFYKLAHGSGTTPAEILQGFVCDLVSGTQTRGSDERDFARQYFDRCNYDFMMQHTFLSWLLQYDRIAEAGDLLETRDYAADDLSYYEQHPEEAEPGLINDLKQTQEEAEQEIAELYREYAKDTERYREPAQEQQEGVEEVKAYLRELENMTAGQQQAGKE